MRNAEYAAGSHVFVSKIEALSQTFSNLRRTRGDGNCFYRAFVYSFLEGLMLNKKHEECARCGQR